MLQHVIYYLEIKNGQFHLIIQEEHLQNEHFNFSTKSIKDIKIIPIDFHTSGTACTVLHARSEIETDKPLLIANSDQILDIDFNIFINDAIDRKLDGSILVFKDKYKDPKWSFANQWREFSAEVKKEGHIKFSNSWHLFLQNRKYL